MERTGFENNDFTGGLSDEYVPTKDNRLDAAENICLDDDLTPIQRPGSGKLDGSNAVFGKDPEQTKIKGLIENTKNLFSFGVSKAFKYNKITKTQFIKQVVDSGVDGTPNPLSVNFNQAVDFVSNPNNTPFPIIDTPTPVVAGSINSFQTRDIVYATNNTPSFTQKFLQDDARGDLSFGVGLPAPPDQFIDNSSALFKRGYNEVSLWRVQETFPIVGPAQANQNRTPYLMPMNPNAPVSTQPGEARADDTYGWSDKPYTYRNGAIIKENFTYKYQFTYVLKITYVVDGVTYEKRSPPVVPMWFLSDIELKQVVTGSPPASGTRTNYYVGVAYSLVEINTLLRAMNIPFYEEGFVELEPYMTDSNGTTFTTRKTYDINGAPTVNGVMVDLRDFYERLNQNQSPLPIAGLFVPPAALTNDNQFQPDFYIKHERQAFETDFATLYTEGGILPYDAPPPAKYIFYAGTYAFYLNIKELSVNYKDLTGAAFFTFTKVPYRLKISNANDPDSVPEGNLVDLPDELTGGQTILDRAIVGTTKEIYRIDGRYNTDGSGLVNGQLLSSETGVLSHKSMVAVKDRLFFCGDDGIYMTDGVAVLNISRHISRTYRRLINSVASDTTGEVISINREAAQEKISAAYDRIYDRILFSFGNYVLTLELKASRFEEAYGAFYGEWFTGVDKSTAQESFSALGIFNDMIVRGDYAGYVYQMSPGYLSDPRTDLVAAPSVWGLSPIIYRLRTTKYAFGSLVVKKWVNFVTFILKRRKVLSGGQSDIDVQVNAYNDGERIRQTLKPAHYNGSRDNVFDENPTSGGLSIPKVITETLVNFQRRFGSSGLRCVTKAVEFTNGLNLVAKSDDFEQALTNGLFASLPNFPTFQWPKATQDIDQKGYILTIDNDNYQTKYLVTAATAATLTVNQTLPTGLFKWKLYSFSTKQFFGLHSLGLVYTTFGSKHSTYTIAEQGGNAGDTGE
jgi:hypothetical protein